MQSLDDLPDDQLRDALRVFRILQGDEPFRAPVGSVEGVAVLNLLRFKLLEFDGYGDAKTMLVRVAVPRRPPEPEAASASR